MSTPDESRRILDGILSETDRSNFEDLAAEHPSAEVLASYAAGTLDPASTRALDRYFEAHPERRSELEELQAFMADAEDAATTKGGPATSGKRPRRFRAATVLLFGVCAAAGYGGGVWQGRHTWRLTVGETLEIAKDPTQPHRNTTIENLLVLHRGITEILKEVANGDPANATTSAEAERMGRDARLRLFWQAHNSIQALEDLSRSENPDVATDALNRLDMIRKRIR